MGKLENLIIFWVTREIFRSLIELNPKWPTLSAAGLTFSRKYSRKRRYLNPNRMTLSTERTGHGQRLVALQHILEQIRLQQQVEPLLELALTFVNTVFDYSLVWIATYRPDRRELMGVQGTLPKSQKTTWVRQELKVLPGDCFDQALLTGQPVVVSNLQEDQRAGQWQAVARRTDIQGALVYPLRHQKQPYGVMILGSHHWGGNPRPEDMTHLSILSSAIGAALHDLQPQQGQSPVQAYEALQTTISQLTLMTGLEERLSVVLEQIHQIFQPTQTSLFWLDTQQQCFWQRLIHRPDQKRRSRGKKVAPLEIPLADVRSLHQTLLAGQIVSVSETEGTVHARTPNRLMQQLQRRSLLSAPVFCQQQLCGFIAVEGAEPRIWQDEDKQLLQAFAQLANLSSPATFEEGLPIGAADNHDRFVMQLLQSVAQLQDWPQMRKQMMEQVCLHLQTQWMVVLQHDSNTGQFRILDQVHPPKLQPPTAPFPALSDVDWNMLRRSEQAIAIDTLADDFRLLTWRPTLDALGVQALLLSADPAMDFMLLLGRTAPNGWTAADVDCLDQVCRAFQAGQQRHQLQIEHQQHRSLNTLVQQGLTAQMQARKPRALMEKALHSLLDILPAPAATVILWEADQAKVVSSVGAPPEFDLTEGISIAWEQDSLLQPLAQAGPPQLHEGEWHNIVQLSVQDLTPDTRAWLNSPALGQVLALPLLDADPHQPIGAVIFCDRNDRIWEPLLVESVALLVRHLAGRYRSLMSLKHYREQQASLECMHWYRFRQVERHCQTIRTAQKHLQASGDSASLLADSQTALDTIEKFMQSAQLQLPMNEPSLPVATLLRRAVSRTEVLANQRQLWLQVHNLASKSAPTEVSPKIEMVLYELLLAACYRSQAGQRIDIWCRLASPEWLELSITDQGIMNPQLLAELRSDMTRPFTLKTPPGQYIKACQTLLKKLGGTLELEQLEDGRILSRLLLPLT